MGDYEGDEYKFSRDQQRQLDKFRDERIGNKSGDRTARGKIKDWKPFNHNRKDTGAGKGDKERPKSIGTEEYGLRYDLAIGKITTEQFDVAMEKLKHGRQ
jgi:hypothetical protein